MLTRRQRLKRCFFYDKPDRPAVYSRPHFPRNDPSYDRLKAYINENAELKATWYSAEFETDTPTEIAIEPHSEDFERNIITVHTPAGDLTSSVLYSLKGQPGMVEKHLFESAEDVEKYLSLPIPELSGDALSSFRELARDKLCLEGNIQIHRMYECTPEEIHEETDKLIQDAFDDHRGLIVRPSASPYIRGEGETCLPQYKAMIDAVLQFKC